PGPGGGIVPVVVVAKAAWSAPSCAGEPDGGKCADLTLFRERDAQFFQGTRTHLRRITFAASSYFDDFLGDKFCDWIATILQLKQLQRRLIRRCHAANFIWIKRRNILQQQAVDRHRPPPTNHLYTCI